MKLRSSSDISLKKHPSINTFSKDLKTHRTNQFDTKEQFITAHKITDKQQQHINSERDSNIKIIYDFDKEIQDHLYLRRQYSRNSQLNTLKRPSTSNRKSSDGYLLPKLNTERKNRQDKLLGISETPLEPLKKMASLSRIDMMVNIQKDDKKKKFRLKQNLLDDMMNQVKKTFRLRIIRGVLQTKSPDLVNLKKIKQKSRQKIQQTMLVIEKFVKKYNIKGNYSITYFPFMNLLSLSNPSNRDIISSFHLQKLTTQLENIPGSSFVQQNGVKKAVVKIQSIFKMWKDRKQYLGYLTYSDKIKYIQKYWRRKLFSINFQRKIKERNIQKINTFNQMQKQFRQKWYSLKNKNRWEIHIPNIGIDQFKKLTTQKLIQQQCAQIIRLFKIAHNFLVNVLFVSPIPLSSQVLNYYYKILEVNHMVQWSQRIKFIHPQNYSKFSSTISISRVLLQSPIALSTIRKTIQNSVSYIISGQYSSADILLSLELKSPIFGCAFNSAYFNTQSGNLDFFKCCQIPTITSARDIYAQQQLINTLAALIFNNPETKKWVLKIDDEEKGRGEAYIVPKSFPMLKSLLSNFIEIRNFQEAVVLESQIVRALADQLKQNIISKLKIGDKNIYKNSKQYLSSFLQKGGIIQKDIEAETIIIGFVVYPDGQLQNIYTSSILKSGTRTIGCISPIKSETFEECQYIVKGISRQLYKREIMGHFVLQIAVSQKQQKKYYCTSLKPYLDSLSCFGYLSALINGMSIPKNINSSENYTIYCPILLHQGLNKQSIKGFFQKCRYHNIEFDVNSKQGVLFLLCDSLQSQCLGVISVGKTYLNMLERLMNGLQFLIRQYEGRTLESRLSVLAMKSNVKVLLNQIKRGSKQQVANLQWLF